jgi:hypothetical protein
VKDFGKIVVDREVLLLKSAHEVETSKKEMEKLQE